VQLQRPALLQPDDEVPRVVTPHCVREVVRTDVAGAQRTEPRGEDGGHRQRAHRSSVELSGNAYPPQPCVMRTTTRRFGALATRLPPSTIGVALP
jgi:hypothetical protein